jgi:energy-coupling factor transporter ATP-binding protein EcfA2
MRRSQHQTTKHLRFDRCKINVKLARAFIIFDRLLMEKRGRGLESIEREILTISWEKDRYSSTKNYQEQTIKNKASRLWKDLSQILGTKIGKQNIRQILAELDLDPTLIDSTLIDLDRTRSRFFGRVSELYILKSTIEVEQRKLVCLHGMQGIGKTTLVRQYTEQLSSKFDRVIWISLADAPALNEILSTIVKELAGGRSAKLARESSTAIAKTLSYLQQYRCLLILDNADALLNTETSQSETLQQIYQQFFEALERVEHRSSCLVITLARPPQIELALELQGLDRRSCQQLLEHSDLIGTLQEWEILITKYRGNPQQLQLVANTIRDLFERQIAKFIAANIPIVARIELLLSAQIDKLSAMELAILSYLSLQTSPVTLDRLVEIYPQLVDTQIIEIVDKLVGKYLIEVRDERFSLPEIIQAYFHRQSPIDAKGLGISGSHSSFLAVPSKASPT